MIKKKEVVKKEEAKLPVEMQAAMQADAGAGMETADKDSFELPFLRIIQKNSPQIDDVVGAKPGLFINTLTEEMFEECIIIPCAFQRMFIQWAPRDEGGGFKGYHDPLSVASGQIEGLGKDKNGFPVIGEDTLADTRTHFVLVKSSSGKYEPAVLSLASTQVKKSKRWMAQMRSLEFIGKNGNPYPEPMFSHFYHLTTEKESSGDFKWHGISIKIGEYVRNHDLYQMAKKFHDEVTAGVRKAPDPVETTNDDEI